MNTTENTVIDITDKPKKEINKKAIGLVVLAGAIAIALMIAGGQITKAMYPPKMPANQQCISSSDAGSKAAKVFADQLSAALIGKDAPAPDMAAVKTAANDCRTHSKEYNIVEAK